MLDIYAATTDIIRRIWKDLTGRSGIDHVLEDLDEETMYDIKAKWHDLITDALIING